jgi:Cu/Ag efflux protein CusF
MRAFSLAFVLLLAASCGRQYKTAPPIQSYRLEGEIIRIIPDRKSAVIRHEAVLDQSGDIWMPPMTMEFPVKDPAEFALIQAGQRIQARLSQQSKTFSYWIDQITPLPQAAGSPK